LRFKKTVLHDRPTMTSTFGGHYAMGVLYEDREDAAGAEAEFRAAIAIDQTSVKARIRLGLVLENHFGDYDGAEDVYRSAITCDSTNPSGYLNLGVLLELHKSDADGAAAAYQEAARLGSNNTGDRTNAVFDCLQELRAAEKIERAQSHVQVNTATVLPSRFSGQTIILPVVVCVTTAAAAAAGAAVADDEPDAKRHRASVMAMEVEAPVEAADFDADAGAGSSTDDGDGAGDGGSDEETTAILPLAAQLMLELREAEDTLKQQEVVGDSADAVEMDVEVGVEAEVEDGIQVNTGSVDLQTKVMNADHP
jgi:tetratricopeptide (TPR) repeat protein